jgi:alkylated DNA repair dioxygenase AlkB
MNTRDGIMILSNEDRVSNLLPKDGTVNYYGKVLTSRVANQYSTKQALAWTKELYELKQMVEEFAGTTFNSCLLNLYHNGDEGMGWHSDDEESIGKNNTIASLSLGAERKFLFKHKQTKQIVSLVLEHGSLLIMKDVTQANWLHSLAKSKNVTQPRINLTFRTIKPQ